MLRISNRFNGRNWSSPPRIANLESTKKEVGYGSGPVYQLDPNDDDMERIPRTVDIDQTKFIEEYDRDREDTRSHDESFFYDERDYEESRDPGLVWPDRYTWDQYGNVNPAFN